MHLGVNFVVMVPNMPRTADALLVSLLQLQVTSVAVYGTACACALWGVGRPALSRDVCCCCCIRLLVLSDDEKTPSLGRAVLRGLV